MTTSVKKDKPVGQTKGAELNLVDASQNIHENFSP